MKNRSSRASRSRNETRRPSIACKSWSSWSGRRSLDKSSNRLSGCCRLRLNCSCGSSSGSANRWPLSLLNPNWSGKPAGSTRYCHHARGRSTSKKFHPSRRNYAGSSHYQTGRLPCNFSVAYCCANGESSGSRRYLKYKKERFWRHLSVSCAVLCAGTGKMC